VLGRPQNRITTRITTTRATRPIVTAATLVVTEVKRLMRPAKS
jgi:hypothetical protein